MTVGFALSKGGHLTKDGSKLMWKTSHESGVRFTSGTLFYFIFLAVFWSPV